MLFRLGWAFEADDFVAVFRQHSAPTETKRLFIFDFFFFLFCRFVLFLCVNTFWHSIIPTQAHTYKQTRIHVHIHVWTHSCTHAHTRTHPPKTGAAVDSTPAPSTPTPCARAWHSATVYEDRMYILGGCLDSPDDQQFWRYTPSDKTTSRARM